MLVESEGEALAAMAAYIDLNAVRANSVNDPMDYRWSGYGQAMAGDRCAQEGLRWVIAGAQRAAPESLALSEAMRQYRVWLFVQGEENEGTDPEGQPLRRGFSPQEVSEVIRRQGRVPVNQYVTLRVRYFVDGVVMGSKAYVNQVFEALRPRFGPKRKDGARRMRGVESNNLYVLRDLKRDVIGWVDKAVAPGQATQPATGAGLPSG